MMTTLDIIQYPIFIAGSEISGVHDIDDDVLSVSIVVYLCRRRFKSKFTKNTLPQLTCLFFLLNVLAV